MKRKLLSIMLTLVLVLGCVPMAVFAADGIESVDFSTVLELGTEFKGTIDETDPYVSSCCDSGYAKGFTVELEAKTPYAFLLDITGENAGYINRTVSIFAKGAYTEEGFEPCENADFYYEHTVWSDHFELCKLFTVPQSGEYEVLVWGYCETVDESTYEALYGEKTSISVMIAEGSDIPVEQYLPLSIDYQLTVGEPFVGTIDEADPYINTYDWGGYAKGFSVELEAGKLYRMSALAECETAKYVDRAISLVSSTEITEDISLDSLKYKSASGETSAKASFAFMPEESGTYYFIEWGYCDDTNGDKIYGEDTSLTVLVEEATITAIDIYTADDLAAFNAAAFNGDYAEKDIALNFCNDIDMTDVEWKNEIYGFYPIVYGNGYTVTNLNGCLLGYCNDIYVFDLDMFADITIETYVDYFGLYAAYVEEGATLIDCDVTCVINVAEEISLEGLGAFVGMIYENGEIKNCTVNASYTFDSISYVGGMVGYVEYFVDFVDCDINVAVDSIGGYTMGGIVGYAEDYNSFTNCGVNVDAYLPDSYRLGGIAGYFDEANRLLNCYTEGTLYGCENVGGLVGVSDCCGYNEIINCYSLADVYGQADVGGLFGEIYECDNFENCYAGGDVVYNGEDEYTGESIGTFFGYSTYDTATFTNCYAKASDDFGTYGYFGGTENEDITGYYDDELVILSYVLNKYAEESYQYDCNNWVIDEAKNAVVFGEFAALDVMDITLAGFEEGNSLDDIDVSFIDGINLEDWIICTDPEDADNTIPSAFEKETDYYLGIMINSMEYRFDQLSAINVNGEDCLYEVAHDSTINYRIIFIKLPQIGAAVEGDVNGDGSVDVFDYITVKSIYFENGSFTDEEIAAADINKDGSVDLFDYMAVKTIYFSTVR